MPLPQTDQEFKNRVLQAGGYDPAQYEMDDDGNVSQSIKLQPTFPTSHEPVPDISNQVQAKPQPSSTALGAMGHSALASIIPTGAGLGGAALAAGLAPETGGLSLLALGLGLGGGALGSYLGGKAQDAVLPDSVKQQLATEHAEHSVASTIGEFIPSVPFFNPIKGVMELPDLARAGGKLLSRGTTAITDAEASALANTAANVGVAGGQNVAEQLGNGQPFDWSQLGVNVAGAGLLNSPTALGEKVFNSFGAHKVSAKPAVEGQPSETNIDAEPVAQPSAAELAARKQEEYAEMQSQKAAQDYEARNEQVQTAIQQRDEARDNAAYNPPVAENTLRITKDKFLPQDISAKPEVKPKPLYEEATPEGGKTPVYDDLNPPSFEKTNAEVEKESAADLQSREEEARLEGGQRPKYEDEPALPADDREPLKLRNASSDYKRKVADLAQKRGITLAEAHEVLTPEGKSVLGQYEGDKRKATLSQTKAELDTPIHEILGHGHLDDLMKSSSKSDNKLGQRALDIFSGDRNAAEEALARKIGVEGVKRADVDLYGTKREKFNAWFEDFKARWKNNLGMANDADVIRHLSARGFHDAPYGSRGELSGRSKYNALVQQHKETKDEGTRVAIRADIEKLKNENGGMPPKEQSEPALKQADVKGRFATDTEKELAKDKPFGVLKDKNGKLPILTLKGKMEKMIPAGELAALRDSGLDEAIKANRDDAGKVDLNGLGKWIKENGPKVEVRKFADHNINEESRKMSELEHALDTAGITAKYNEHGDQITGWQYNGRNVRAEEMQSPHANKMIEMEKLYNSIRNDTSGTAHWQSISPKPESEMKGYTEIAVVKPTVKRPLRTMEKGVAKEHPDRIVEDANSVKFPPSHNFPPNTLAWVRGHMETDPSTGKKTFLIHEVQSDWAAKQKQNEHDISTYGDNPPQWVKEWKSIDDPLLAHYESLALKAAIEHARSEGADSIAISDAPTAMMTEGHDRAGNIITHYEKNGLKQDLDVHNNPYAHKNLLDAGWKVVNEAPKQNAGMRAAYDSRLPNIAKKLTGHEGEVKEFGEHKMARRNGFSERIEGDEAEATRKDLIFRNPDGTPKTSVTARTYPIDAISQRLETGEPYSMFHTKYQDKGALRPEDVELGNKSKLSAKQNEQSGDDTIHLRLTRSESDSILAKDGPRARPAVTAIAEQQAKREEYAAKYNNAIDKALKGLSTDDKTHLEKTLIAENTSKTSYREGLNEKQQGAYDALRDTMRQMQEDRIANEQPVKSFDAAGKSVMRDAKVDPYYWPNQIAPDVIETLKHSPDSERGIALKKDFMDFQAEHYVSEEQAQQMLDGILGSYSKSTPNLAHFRGVDIEQGHGLPQSFMRGGIERNLERYVNRFSNARAFHDAVESKPEVAPLFGIKKSPWGEEYDKSVKPLASPEAHDAFARMTGSDYNAEHGKIRSIERVGSSLILGPATSLHIYASTVANALSHAMPHEIAGMVSEMATHIKDGFAHAKESGILSRKSFKQITSNFLDAHSSAQERLNALSDIVAKVSGRDALGNLAKAQAQIGGEYLVKSRIELAKLGDTKVAKQAQRFMKQVDPYWNAEKSYSPEDIKRMGTNFARSLHGHSSATQPNWMLKDNIVQPFVSLMSWNIAQTNAFMKNVYTPAVRDGNYTPLLMSTLGAALGGYVIKEAREKLMNKKSPIPSFSELAASDKGLSGNIPLVAYNLMAMTSFAGFGGILSTAARTAFDAAYKNPAQGAVFPLDEVVSNTARTLTQAYGALANSKLEDYPLIGTKAGADLLRENIQLARIGLSWADESGALGKEREAKKKLTQEEEDLRRFKVAEGTPYEDQSSIDESNPYFNLARKKFQKTQDIQEAMTQLPSLIDRAFEESNGNIEVLKNKLRTLKETSYPSMPSPDRTPMTFWKYVEYLNKTEGPEKASQRVGEYMQNNMINKMKGAMVPSF